VRDRSIKSNAQRHLGAEWVLNLDLENFFPSIHFGRVRGLFSHKPYNLPEEAAQTLAQICCYNRMLPVGAPTSPIVANMVCARLDAQAKQLARQYGCVYTRYADDITFSTRSRRFAPAIVFRDANAKAWVLGQDLRNVVSSKFFVINEKKTRVRGKNARQEITGLCINEGLNVPRELVRQVRAMLHAWENYGEAAAQDHFLMRYDRKQRAQPPKSFRAVLRGKIEFIGFVRGRDDGIYVGLLTRFLFLDEALRARPVLVGPGTVASVVGQAIWLLLDKDGDSQGTAFAIEGGHLLTAAHCVNQQMRASRPWLENKQYPVVVEKIDEIRDVAQVAIVGRTPVALRLGNSSGMAIGTSISLLGFPNYHVGDSVSIRRGSITQSRTYIDVPHYIIDADIVVGNSGGPVLNDKNEVIGIAVKGLGTPGIFSQYDQLSSFVPVDLLQYMKEVPAAGLSG
jgi:RNA-directed DNA polymerase